MCTINTYVYLYVMYKENTCYVRVVFIQKVYTDVYPLYLQRSLHRRACGANDLTQKFETNEGSLNNSYGCFVAKVQGVFVSGVEKKTGVCKTVLMPPSFWVVFAHISTKLILAYVQVLFVSGKLPGSILMHNRKPRLFYIYIYIYI
jgi:hypothetical protein